MGSGVVLEMRAVGGRKVGRVSEGGRTGRMDGRRKMLEVSVMLEVTGWEYLIVEQLK